MKELKSIFIFAIVLLFLQSCEQRNSKGINSVICEREELGLQSLEITSGDTVNVTDVKGLKQGYWIVFGFEPTGDKGPNETKEVMSNSVQHTIIEKGTYKDNKKQGVWKYFNKDGTIKSTKKYKDDVPVKS